ncbi:hypothetical protein D0B54_11220 [Solimonas sp. K1W22B-7]|uniref:hypothetical protein n=1 Tax=Solimonas sp. K1W22B-7 TaxID=2303331 RepID=UPI000E32E1FA|nr:hypothetical protein [Solimonas sp. K1W22B-7]AXQ29224.1 hypothetical protein D0B54_11220 [Solimonas sp. K1W22B-7]
MNRDTYRRAVFHYMRVASMVMGVICVLFCFLAIYDVAFNGRKWGYPIWTLLVLLGFIAILWIVHKLAKDELAKNGL